ncbi:transglutaminase family protein [Aliikangiella sp. IMCC44359]|uniref:transglutaminase family protein n=1 Tax=Aliikangiella sp. IMCC44359 TaxID=3459125 RepID=UPI00403B37A7
MNYRLQDIFFLKFLFLLFYVCGGELLANNYSAHANSQYPLWSHLTKLEINLLNQQNRARRSVPENLLQLYLVSSGDVRDWHEYEIIKHKLDKWVEQFIAEGALDLPLRERAEKLHQKMHRDFFLNKNVDINDDSGYDFEQSQLSEVFRSKKYNCVSSSLLFSVLANKMGFHVRGIMMPSHIFIELDLDNGDVVEVETTSASGFGWLHDEDFYQQENTDNWFANRGLSPSTYEDYLAREKITPFQMGVQNMRNQHNQPGRMDYVDRMRLIEIMSELSPDNYNLHMQRLSFYMREYERLKKLGDYKKLDRMYEHITPYLQREILNFNGDLETQNMMGWIRYQQIISAIKNQRLQFGNELAWFTLDTINKDIVDYEKIKNNIYFALSLSIKKDLAISNFIRARAVFSGKEGLCKVENTCMNILRNIYSSWASFYWNKKNWPKVIQIYQDFFELEMSGKAADVFRSNLQSAYLNWSNSLVKKNNWAGASSVLKQCIAEASATERCNSRLAKIESHPDLR